MATNFTPGPWKWWTSNSYKRLMAEWGGHTQPVIEPTVAPDGHPDCIITEADMALIESVTDLYEALEHCEAVMSIVEPRSDKAEYLECLKKARLAVLKARGETGE